LASIKEYRCEICGDVSANPVHWFLIHCGPTELTVGVWDAAAADAAGARHLCGEADAQVYISRWFESMCSPPKPDYSSMPSGQNPA
jgi:hypothetical protein